MACQDAVVPAVAPMERPNAMTPPAVGLGTLRRLRELPTGGQPVLSLYLDLDRSTHSNPAACEQRLGALVASLTPCPSRGDGERAREMLHGLPALAHGVRGLALFSTAEGSSSAIVALPDSVGAMAVIETVPWLEPLAGLFAPGDWGVAVLGEDRTRLFRGSTRTLVEFATLQHELPDTRALCGFSPIGPRRSARQRVLAHARRTSELLLRAHRRRPFEQLLLAAPQEMGQLLESALESQLRDRLAGGVTLDLQTAPVRQIELAIAPLLRVRRTSGVRRPERVSLV